MNKKTILTILFFLLTPLGAYASETSGTILSGYGATKICKDVSCGVFGNINWRPTINGSTTGATAVTITDSGLSGNLWGDEVGWVNLAPTGSGVTINASTGALSGYAYANTGGWINFRPTQTSGNPTVGVTINSSGEFTGYAYVSGLNGGWMKFDCASGSTCIKTDWRPIPNRTVPVVPTPVIGVVGLQYIKQPVQPVATETPQVTPPLIVQNPDNIQIPQKPKYPITNIHTGGGSYTGWVSSSTDQGLGGSTTTLIDINGEPTSITITVRPHGNTVPGIKTPTSSSSAIELARSKERLLAYPFIPERAKWRIPTSRIAPALQAKAHVAIPDVDGTSMILTLLAGAVLWKLGALALLLVTRLFR